MKKHSRISDIISTCILILSVCILFSVIFSPKRRVEDHLFDVVNEEGVVIVDNSIVTDLELVFAPMYDHIHVYITQALHQLGYELIEQEKGVFLLEEMDKQFILNIEDTSLYEIGNANSNNYIGRPEGGYYYCHAIAQDILIDTDSLNKALILMGSTYRIRTIIPTQTVIFYQLED